ncbi:MAG TPA: VOC family protein [Sphingomicrobium sp.]|nr:VOC family protein [Sphingomicrobium sp.]
MKVRGFAWAGLATDNFDRSLRFFTKVLGLPVETLGEDLAILTVGPGQQLEIFGGDNPGRLLNVTPTIAFEVEDFAAAREELVSAGVELVGDVGRWNGYEWQYFRSPDGHLFEIKRVPQPSVPA